MCQRENNSIHSSENIDVYIFDFEQKQEAVQILSGWEKGPFATHSMISNLDRNWLSCSVASKTTEM